MSFFTVERPQTDYNGPYTAQHDADNATITDSGMLMLTRGPDAAPIVVVVYNTGAWTAFWSDTE